MGIGDWGLGIGDWAQSPIPNPHIGRQATDEEIREMVRKCSRDGKMNIGAMEVLTPADMEAIYRLANA